MAYSCSGAGPSCLVSKLGIPMMLVRVTLVRMVSLVKMMLARMVSSVDMARNGFGTSNKEQQ